MANEKSDGAEGVNEQDLAGLSDEERAALAQTSNEEDALRAIAGEAGDDGGEDGEDGAQDDAGEGSADAADENKPPAPPAATPAPTPAPAASSEAAPTPAPQDPVSYTIAAPEDADAQIAALNTEKAGFFKKLMDGAITPEEYSAKESEITGKVLDINRQLTSATVAAEITMQNAQRSWLGKVNALMDTALKNEGVDYRGNKELHEALDRTVKWLAQDPSNADKPEQWFLDEAHTMVKTRFQVGKASTAPSPAPAASVPAAPRSGKAPQLENLPPNISRQPAAAESDDGGEFAHLSKLSGMALEQAIARMTPEQQERWAQES